MVAMMMMWRRMMIGCSPCEEQVCEFYLPSGSLIAFTSLAKVTLRIEENEDDVDFDFDVEDKVDVDVDVEDDDRPHNQVLL